jgi:excisionase family DNA binding protein
MTDETREEAVQRLKQELFGDVYSPEEVATVLGVQPSTVMRYLREYQILGFKIGKTWKIREAEIAAFKERLMGEANSLQRLSNESSKHSPPRNRRVDS